jgi:hypothetical protein
MTILTFPDLARFVRQSVTSVTGERELTPGDSMAELGIDSIATLNIIVEAAEAHGLDLDALAEDGAPPATLGELHGMLVALIPVNRAA